MAHLWLKISLTSLLRARAMERAMLVLPTPGGPWKQRIFPWVVPLSCATAMNSEDAKINENSQYRSISYIYKQVRILFSIKNVMLCGNRVNCLILQGHLLSWTCTKKKVTFTGSLPPSIVIFNFLTCLCMDTVWTAQNFSTVVHSLKLAPTEQCNSYLS